MPPVNLEKRYWFYDDDYGDSGWYSYGRWISLAVIIFVVIVGFLFVQGLSCRRARHGQQPIAGTSWMVPPSYYQSQQQQHHEDAVPMYKQEAGQGDAGHYDEHGNFIPYTGPQYTQESYYAPPPGPPPGHSGAQTSAATSNTNDHTNNSNDSNNYADYAPPSMPPPSHSGAPNYEDAGPPDGPPPSARDYYRPSKDFDGKGPAPPQAARLPK